MEEERREEKGLIRKIQTSPRTESDPFLRVSERERESKRVRERERVCVFSRERDRETGSISYLSLVKDDNTKRR